MAGQSYKTPENFLKYRVLEMHFPVKGYKLLFVRAFHTKRRRGGAPLLFFERLAVQTTKLYDFAVLG